MAEIAALRRKLSDYLPSECLAGIDKAYQYSEGAHAGQRRANGKPYIQHPLTVADILADWHFDSPTVIAALLHDVVEDTPITLEQIKETFGGDIARLVDGLSKIDRLEGMDQHIREAENFRKLILAAAEDWRVVFIKLADRLHNMRTLSAITSVEKRRRIANETLSLYVPISNRLGFSTVRDELQELSFRYLHPYRYRILKKASQNSGTGNRQSIVSLEEKICADLAAQGIEAIVEKRKKNLYSIYEKMNKKHITFAEVEDIVGFRLIVNNRQECYLCMGIMHESFTPNPARFKDYIAVPKYNGYQSLHTSVISPSGIKVELQIRTRAMHEIAERGLASHWIYKQGKKLDKTQHEALDRLSSLMLLHAENETSGEFIEHVKIDLSPREMYVLTPKGKILSLPMGSSALDFAYAVHTDLGDHAERAVINGRIEPLSMRLTTGDQVKITKNIDIRPQLHWLSIAKTARARSRIRHSIAATDKKDTIVLGEKMLLAAAARLDESLSINDIGDEKWRRYLSANGMNHREDLYLSIGLGKTLPAIAARGILMRDQRTVSGGKLQPLLIAGSGNAAVKLSHCCRPLPEEPIIGILRKELGLNIHSGECPMVKKLNRRSEKWIEVAWGEKAKKKPLLSAVILECMNSPSLITTISRVISNRNINIVNLNFSGASHKHETISLSLMVEVHNLDELMDLFGALERTPEVLKAKREMKEI